MEKVHPVKIESTSSFFSGGGKRFCPPQFWSPGPTNPKGFAWGSTFCKKGMGALRCCPVACGQCKASVVPSAAELRRIAGKPPLLPSPPVKPAPAGAKNVLMLVVDDLRPEIGVYGSSYLGGMHSATHRRQRPNKVSQNLTPRLRAARFLFCQRVGASAGAAAALMRPRA